MILTSKPVLAFASLSECLQARASSDRDVLAFRFYDGAGKPVTSLTYGELDRRARALAMRLGELGVGGKPVVLTYSPGLEFVVAFYACQYAGAIAVPAYPPDPRRLAQSLPRLNHLLADTGARFVLADRRLVNSLELLDMRGQAASWLGAVHWPGGQLIGGAWSRYLSRLGQLQRDTPPSVQWIATDDSVSYDTSRFVPCEAGPDSLAYLQYTSGSTKDPRGVRVSQANILANVAMATRMISINRESIAAGWAPLYHDLGLVCYVIASVVTGFPSHLMSPLDFLRRPMAWLELMSQVRATHAGAPNFAYQLCVRKSDPATRARLDLRHWLVAGNGGEPVRSTTLADFADTFASAGFQRSSFMPCYGAAEAALFIASSKHPGSAPRVLSVDAGALAAHRIVRVSGDRADRVALVSHGRTGARHELRIVKPGTVETLPDGRIGEILFRGPSVSAGYYGTEPGSDPFGVQLQSTLGMSSEPPPAFLRTGDLGCIHDGELFITGRCRDLLIVHGRNLYPNDLEASLESAHLAVRAGCSVVFSRSEQLPEEIVVVAEVNKRLALKGGGGSAVISAIMHRLQAEHQVQIHHVVLIHPRTLPKTSSGKVQRSQARNRFSEGALQVFAEYRRDNPPGKATGGQPSQSASGMTCELTGLIGEILRKDIEPNDSLVLAGLDSLALMELVEAVSLRTGVCMEPLEVFSAGTVARLSDLISAQPNFCGWQPAIPASAYGKHVAAARGGELQPASDAQQLFWNMQRLLPGSSRSCAVLEIRGELTHAAVDQAWGLLLEDNPVLRARYEQVDNRLFFAVMEQTEPAFSWIDAANWSRLRRQQAIDAEVHRHFDLSRPPLARCQVYQLGNEHHLLQLIGHHIALDMWSFSRLTDDFLRLLGSEAGGLHVQRRPTSLPVAAPAGPLLTANVKPEVPKLAGLPPAGSLLYRTAVHHLTPAQVRQLKQRAARWQLPLSTLILAVFSRMLGEQVQREELLIAVPVTTRTPATIAVSGPMMNFQPAVLRTAPDSAPETSARRAAKVVSALLERRLESPCYAADGSDFPDVHFNFCVFENTRMSDRLKALHTGCSVRVGSLDISMQSLAAIETMSPVAVGLMGVMVHDEIILWLNARPDVLARPAAGRLMKDVIASLELDSVGLSA